MKLGVDRLLGSAEIRKPLAGKRVALLGHPASMTSPPHFKHALYAIAEHIKLSAAFGPQHGMLGDKQDNMIESQDFTDPQLKIPVFSLYGEVRKPTPKMMDTFDTLLVDLQDVGCRIYTFLTTLFYLLEECALKHKSLWVLDRPNPLGRKIEGMTLHPDWKSFVGHAPTLLCHGLTLGEAARWHLKHARLDVDLKVIEMEGYEPSKNPWPYEPWVNPSPNAANLNMARCFPGTVLIEGTELSEGRGTTRPLELVGAPEIEPTQLFNTMKKIAPQWLEGALIRECHFLPTFQKHQGKLCHGLQFHTDYKGYRHETFRPYRATALLLKALRTLQPELALWHDRPYEYESTRKAIDLINGSDRLRKWVDDPSARPADLESVLVKEEKAWEESRAPFLIYK